MSVEVQELAVRYGAAWAERDFDAIMVMHTDDTVFHLHGGGEPAPWSRRYAGSFPAALAQWPDIRFERKRVHIGEGHFVTEYEMSATSDGQAFTCDGADVVAVEGGRVARKDMYLDWPAIQQQLGEATSAVTA